MKTLIKMLLFALTLTACGTDETQNPPNRTEAAVPFEYEEGYIYSEGVDLKNGPCEYSWPKAMPYEVDALGDYHANGKVYSPVAGQPNTWVILGERVNGYRAITTFTITDDIVHLRLRCHYLEPIEHAL